MRLERWVVLTTDEARDLLEALTDYFDQDPPDPDWHHHLGAGDTQVTLAVDSTAPD